VRVWAYPEAELWKLESYGRIEAYPSTYTTRAALSRLAGTRCH